MITSLFSLNVHNKTFANKGNYFQHILHLPCATDNQSILSKHLMTLVPLAFLQFLLYLIFIYRYCKTGTFLQLSNLPITITFFLICTSFHPTPTPKCISTPKGWPVDFLIPAIRRWIQSYFGQLLLNSVGKMRTGTKHLRQLNKSGNYTALYHHAVKCKIGFAFCIANMAASSLFSQAQPKSQDTETLQLFSCSVMVNREGIYTSAWQESLQRYLKCESQGLFSHSL